MYEITIHFTYESAVNFNFYKTTYLKTNIKNTNELFENFFLKHKLIFL